MISALRSVYTGVMTIVLLVSEVAGPGITGRIVNFGVTSTV